MKTSWLKTGETYSVSNPVFIGAFSVTSSMNYDDDSDDLWSLQYEETTITIDTELKIKGEIKSAAKAIFHEIQNDEAISTAWNNILKVYHNKNRFELEYLGKNSPEFFDELNKEFKALSGLRVFL